jgi:hypothetical protein
MEFQYDEDCVVEQVHECWKTSAFEQRNPVYPCILPRAKKLYHDDYLVSCHPVMVLDRPAYGGQEGINSFFLLTEYRSLLHLL